MKETANVINELAKTIHNENVSVGWWDDVSEVESLKSKGVLSESLANNILLNCVSSKIALMHSELSEALEGLRKGLMDDKLPHREMIEVEFADAIIRILDSARYLGLDVGGAITEKLKYNRNRADHKRENRQQAGGKKI